MPFGPLTTTSVGSFPRPTWLAQTQRNQLDYRVDNEHLDEALDDATIVVLREQEELRLDVLTDGEMRRRSFIFHIAGTWEGIDTATLGHKGTYRNRAVDRLVPRVTGKVVRHEPAPVVNDLRFARRYTASPLKMAVPGPMTVIDSTANQHYSDEAELAMDIAAAINAELLDLQSLGCQVLQIDEPAMTRYHDKVRDYGAKALDRCLEGIQVPTIVHLCYGYPGGVSLQHQYEYTDLLPELMQTRIGGFTVEFARSSFDPGVLAACGSRIVVFGCIDPGDSPVPTVDSVMHKIGNALDTLDPKQVWLAPDCGLMTISRDVAREKLRVMVEAAQRTLRKL